MILKNNMVLYGALLLCLPSMTFANITSLQSWDPIPFYNAANLNMPPDTPFCYGVKKRMLDENTDKHRRWGINISPFVQRAIRAQQAEDVYFGVAGASTITPGRQMSDYQGTAFLMGLFLGQDINGYSIWGGPTAVDTGVATDITTATVAATQLPAYLQSAVNALNNNPVIITTTPPDYDDAIIYNVGSNDACTSPSILSQSVLDQDPTYFGAFSVPLAYQKTGFRWELNFDFSDSVGFVARGGFCQITQRAAPPISLSDLAPATQTSTSGNNLPSIYGGLNSVANARSGASGIGGSGGIPFAQSQATFNEWVTNNIDDLLDPTYGANYNIQTFAESGIEDIQLLAFIRHPFAMHPADPNKYASIIVTPYAMIGWTVPIAPVKDYSKLYALPFGNNSHTSVGGVFGLTFDFIDSIEFGVEFGATGFLEKTIYGLPVPNHILQRVIYPYKQDVKYAPGFNGQISAIFNAYEFARNTSFSFRYDYVQHMQDTITLITASPYFFPYYLEELTPWSSQMCVAALTFEIQPSIFISVAWQAALAQRNAYCSNTVMGSLNFLF